MINLRFKKQKGRVDSQLLLVSLSLTILGIIVVADASAPIALSTFSDRYYFVKQQVIWAAVGLVSLVICSKIKYNFWEKIATPFFIINIIFLIIVLIPAFSTETLGARRWLIIKDISYQPTELVKLSLSIFLAKLASKNKRLFSLLFALIVIEILTMLQPDLGTAIIIATIALSQIFVSGVNLFDFTKILITGFISVLLLIFSSDYRRDRLLTFLQSTYDPLGKSYHIRQILYALGAGGVFGVGLGQSRQKFLFLPESATDSIFAVIAEETGFIGSIILIVIYIFFIQRCIKISKQAPDKFTQTLAVGLLVWIGFQAYINIASMVALVPLTGIPLPFISYGGSSLITILTATGILLNISRYETKAKSKK